MLLIRCVQGLVWPILGQIFWAAPHGSVFLNFKPLPHSRDQNSDYIGSHFYWCCSRMPTTGKKRRGKKSILFWKLQKMHNHQSESNPKITRSFPTTIKKSQHTANKKPTAFKISDSRYEKFYPLEQLQPIFFACVLDWSKLIFLIVVWKLCSFWVWLWGDDQSLRKVEMATRVGEDLSCWGKRRGVIGWGRKISGVGFVR